MCVTYNLSYGPPIPSQEEYRKLIQENLPKDEDQLFRLNEILSNA